MDSDSADPAGLGHTSQLEPDWYQVELQGRLDERWSAWFDGMTITTDRVGTTVLRGPVRDQAALHGLLARLRDANLPLISLRRLATPGGEGGCRRG